jgi:4-hydroxybenzoate polyprenyltransferase
MQRFGTSITKYRLYIGPIVYLVARPLQPTARDRWLAGCFACLTLGAYILNKVTDLEEDERNPGAEPIARSAAPRALKVALILMLAPIPCVAWASLHHLGLYLALMVLGFWYSVRMPLLSREVRLKDVLLVKNVVTTLAWTAVLVVVPALARPGSPTWLYEFLQTFSLLMIISLLWDVRDLEGDAQAGVRTVANTWGVAATKVICTAFLLLLTTVALKVHSQVEVTFLPTVVGTLVAILAVHAGRPARYYHGIAVLWVLDVVALRAGWLIDTSSLL